MLQNGVLTQLDDVKERKGNHGSQFVIQSNEYQHNVCVVENHARQKCSAARDATCGKCNKSGHFAKVCLSAPRKVGAITPKGKIKMTKIMTAFSLEKLKA